MQYDKLILPVSIVLWCAIIAWSFLWVQIFKQSSIEKQKLIELEYEKEIKEKELTISENEFELTKAQTNKEYISNRKKECLNIYETESKKYNNVNSYSYNTTEDACYLEYRNWDWKEWDPLSTKYFSKSFDDNTIPVNYVTSGSWSRNLDEFYNWWKKFLFEFYNLIDKWQLEEAYLISAKKVDLSTFKSWYNDILWVTVENVSKYNILENQFKVIVSIVDVDENKKTYTVVKTLAKDNDWYFYITGRETLSVK